MNKRIVESMRRVLLRRIVENLDEVDVIGKDDKVIISKDLKIRHIPSQFEYTVADVLQDAGDEVVVKLRAPDASRFDDEAETLEVDQETLEKEYEVK